MSVAESTAHPLTTAKKYAVNSKLLFSLYGVIPLSLFIVFADKLFFNSALQNQFLPVQPAEWAFWAIVFNFPHIVSSLITLADKEYVTYYKARFSKALIIIIAGVLSVNYVTPLLIPQPFAGAIYALFFAFFATYTMYHVLSQQFGIGMMLMKVRPTKKYEWWRWTSTIGATAIYAIIFAKDIIQQPAFASVHVYEILVGIASIFILAATIIGFSLTRDSQAKIGTLYVYSNIAMLIAGVFFLLMDYPVFVIAIPRFVHDVTAFIIYSTHDQNRNSEVKNNYIYRALAFLPFPPLVLCPLIAIGLANGIESAAEAVDATLLGMGMPEVMKIGLQITFICGFFHYYIESFVWKREAIHRHAVKFN
ncbi:Uncharacterised protein [BD1-7 clade bacterium]|uniref:Uncharacterized protein n=1 Tax=BD1-7 clade bacterium TaxID=2029982 RepID=A0A5S9QRK1_9GAMM|nr:Uncharacterised protein [BD1-7 clade bacterium]CAA0120858.1 Uncharacterised protein [BD1-7 clade bacterium]